MTPPDLKVITVINPQNVTVVIRPQEILQVIFTGRERLSWSIPSLKDTTRDELEKTISLKPIRWETFYSDGFERDGRGNFHIASLSKKQEERQNHYWFRVNPADHMKVQKMTEKERTLGTLRFHDGRAIIGKLTVVMEVSEKDKDAFYDLMEATVWTGRDPVGNEAYAIGVTNRKIDEEAGYILNPSDNEQIIFETDQREMLIEAVEPLGLVSGKWKIVAAGNEDNFAVIELQYRMANGKRIQRILAKNFLHSLPPGIEKMRLGTIKLRALDSDNKHCPRMDKMLHLWTTRYRDVTTDFSDDEDFDVDEQEMLVQQLRRMMMAEPIEVCKPKRSLVKIEEFSKELTEGAKLIQVFAPRVYEREVIDPQNNMNVSLVRGCKLVVHLYRDQNFRAPYYKTMDWSVSYPSDCLILDYVETDPHRQRFFFTRHDHPYKATETLTFRCGDRKRIIHIHMDEKFSQCSIYDIDCED